MSRFFRLPDFSPFWFWLGALAGSLFWYGLTRLYPRFEAWKKQRAQRRAEKEAARLERLTAVWRQELERHLHRRHMAGALFPLGRVLLTPRVIAPLPAYVAEGDFRPDDIASLAVPYTPDFPELAALYRYPALSIAEALQGGADLLLWGRAGSGKSTALAYLALLAVRRDERLGALSTAFPLLVHVADLPLPLEEGADPVEALVAAAGRDMPPKLLKVLPRQIRKALESGRVLLLVDGADEMAPSRQPALAAFLRQFKRAHRNVRLVVAASPEYSDGLQALGLRPVTMLPWSQADAQRFLDRWRQAWEREVWPQLQAQAAVGVEEAAEEASLPEPPDARLLNRWLLTPAPAYNPLELTLKAWAAYAGDLLGPTPSDALLAYLRRLLPSEAEEERSLAALEALALQLVLGPGDAVTAREIGQVTTQGEPGDEDAASEAAPAEERKPPRVRRLLPELTAAGVIVAYAGERIGLVHPLVRDYLAGRALAAEGGEERLLQGEWWAARTEALGFLAAAGGGGKAALGLLERDDVLTHAEALAALRAVARGGEGAWRGEVLRYVAALVSDVSLALSSRARAVAALAMSGEKGLGVLFRKMMGHEDLTVRWLAALGAGAVHDAKAVAPLAELLYDPSRAVQGAAALALVAIGTLEALEAVAALLLNGDDMQRRVAAEALANHPGEGHETLREGIHLEDDVRVRRAAVYGLARISASWARELLTEAQIQDSQWVVRDAAAALLEQRKGLSPFVPRPLGPLHEAPWLLAFAAERGMGVAPQAALALLHQVLAEGTPEQKEAALERVPYYPGEDWGKELYAILFGRGGPLRDAAFLALWQLVVAGAALPSPTQFGFA